MTTGVGATRDKRSPQETVTGGDVLQAPRLSALLMIVVQWRRGTPGLPEAGVTCTAADLSAASAYTARHWPLSHRQRGRSHWATPSL